MASLAYLLLIKLAFNLRITLIWAILFGNFTACRVFPWFCFLEIIWEVVCNYFLPYLSQFLLWKYRWEEGCWKLEGPGTPQHPSYLLNLLHPRDSERTCCRLDWEASYDHHPKKLPVRYTHKNDSFLHLKYVKVNMWSLHQIYIISKSLQIHALIKK